MPWRARHGGWACSTGSCSPGTRTGPPTGRLPPSVPGTTLPPPAPQRGRGWPSFFSDPFLPLFFFVSSILFGAELPKQNRPNRTRPHSVSSGGWTGGASAARLGEGDRNSRRQGCLGRTYGSWDLDFPPDLRPRAPPSPRLFSLRNHSANHLGVWAFEGKPGGGCETAGAGEGRRMAGPGALQCLLAAVCAFGSPKFPPPQLELLSIFSRGFRPWRLAHSPTATLVWRCSRWRARRIEQLDTNHHYTSGFLELVGHQVAEVVHVPEPCGRQVPGPGVPRAAVLAGPAQHLHVA